MLSFTLPALSGGARLIEAHFIPETHDVRLERTRLRIFSTAARTYRSWATATYSLASPLLPRIRLE